MARNRPTYGTSSLVDDTANAIRAALPADWQFEVGLPADADALFRLGAPDGTTATVLVQAKAFLEPRDAPRVAERIERLAAGRADAAMVVTAFVSPLMRDRLAELDIGWFDRTGNLRLRVNRPSVFIDRSGADRNPDTDPNDRRLKSLRGSSAAKVVLGLCDQDLPVGVRMLTRSLGVSVSTSARVLDLLGREAVIERGDQGEVIAVRKRALVRRWTDDYGLTRSNEVTATVDPRGLDHTAQSLRESGIPYVATGSLAQRSYLPSGVVPVSPLVSLAVYTDDPLMLMRTAGLRKTDRGANVLVISPYDDIVLTSARTVGDFVCATPAQVVADLLTGPGRSTEEAEQLLEVLAADDPGWAS